MSDFPAYQDEDDILAGEYVLGVLDATALDAARKRLETDRVFADRVTYWEAQFDGFNAEYASVSPPKRLKTSLEARLFGTPRRWWQRGRIWLGGGLVTAALAIAVVITLPVTSPPDFRADLQADQSALAFTAAFDRDFGVLKVSGLATEGLEADKSYELWVIPSGGTPVSLGVVTARTERRLAPDTQAKMIAGATLAVTIEVSGGSPTGAPQGPVVASGALKTL